MPWESLAGKGRVRRDFQEKVTFKLRTGVNQREPRFYQAEKTAYVDALRREHSRFEEIKAGAAGAEWAGREQCQGWDVRTAKEGHSSALGHCKNFGLYPQKNRN